MNLATVAIKAFVPARDFALSQRFYQAIGFAMPWADEELAYLRAGDCAFLLQNFHEPVHSANFQMHLQVENVDDWHRRLLEQDIAVRFGVQIGMPADQPWAMRDFTLFDPTGVLWRVAQNLPGAVGSWDVRMAALWRELECGPGAVLVDAVDALAAERPARDAAALFERAAARDTAGLEREAEPLYRQALAAPGLDDYRRSRATVQLASTLRILGRLDESEQLLLAELARQAEPGHERALHDEARATLALTYAAQGRMQEAAALALGSLAPHLSRYRRSMAANAVALGDRHWGD